MAKTPTADDLAVPGASGPRPVASYDTSAYGAGAQALARGETALGKGVEDAAQDVIQVQVDKQRQSVENAGAQLSTAYINNRTKFGNSNNPDDLTAWTAANKQAESLYTSNVPAPDTPLGAHALARRDTMAADENLRVGERVHTVTSSAAKAGILNGIQTVTDGISYDPSGKSDATAEVALQSLHSGIDQHLAAGNITPEEAEVFKQHAATRFVESQARSAIRQASVLRQNGDVQGSEKLYADADAMLGGQLKRRAAISQVSPGGAASVVAQAETGDATIGVKAIGNISPDTNGSKSYGFMGLNSASGSAGAFVSKYGSQFGLTAQPGTPAFDAQWHAAAIDNSVGFRKAQLQYFSDNHIGPVVGELQRYGIPANIAADPRVATYFADRHVQMNTIGLGNVSAAWAQAGGDVPRFLQNMGDIDRQNLPTQFRSAIASGVYSTRGNETRLDTRLRGALAVGTVGPNSDRVDDTGAAAPEAANPGPATPDHPLAGLARAALSPQQIDSLQRQIETSRRADEVADQRAQIQAEKARKQQTEGIKDEYFKDANSGNSQKGPRDVAFDPRLEGNPEAKTQILEMYSRANKPDPISHISQKTFNGFVERMELPYGDPRKINDLDEIRKSYHADPPLLSNADFEKLEKRFKDDRSSDGATWKEREDAFMKSVRPEITKLDLPMNLHDNDAENRVYRFTNDLRAARDQRIKDNKDPIDLITPGNPAYMGVGSKIVETYKANMEAIIKRMVDGNTDKALADTADKSAPAPKPFDPATIKSKEELRDAVKTNKLSYEAGVQMMVDRGWGTRKAPVAAPVNNTPQIPLGGIQ